MFYMLSGEDSLEIEREIFETLASGPLHQESDISGAKVRNMELQKTDYTFWRVCISVCAQCLVSQGSNLLSDYTLNSGSIKLK